MKTLKTIFSIMILLVMTTKIVNAQPIALTLNYTTTSVSGSAQFDAIYSEHYSVFTTTPTDTLDINVGDTVKLVVSLNTWITGLSSSYNKFVLRRKTAVSSGTSTFELPTDTINFDITDTIFTFTVDTAKIYEYWVTPLGTGTAYPIMFRIRGVTPTGINDHGKVSVDMKAFPNPATDKLTVTFNTKDDHEKIEIFDIQGRLVLSDTEERENGKNTVKIDVSTYSSGIYFVRVAAETFKIIKQ